MSVRIYPGPWGPLRIGECEHRSQPLLVQGGQEFRGAFSLLSGAALNLPGQQHQAILNLLLTHVEGFFCFFGTEFLCIDLAVQELAPGWSQTLPMSGCPCVNLNV